MKPKTRNAKNAFQSLPGEVVTVVRLCSEHFAGPAGGHRRFSKLHSAEIRIDSRQNGVPGAEQRA